MIHNAMIRPRIASSRCSCSTVDSDVMTTKYVNPSTGASTNASGIVRVTAKPTSTTANAASDHRATTALECCGEERADRQCAERRTQTPRRVEEEVGVAGRVRDPEVRLRDLGEEADVHERDEREREHRDEDAPEQPVVPRDPRAGQHLLERLALDRVGVAGVVAREHQPDTANTYVTALIVKTDEMPKSPISGAPIAGPMTRERFICTDCSDTAPGRSSRGTSVGRIAPMAGAFSALAMPIASTHRKISVLFGWSTSTRPASTNESSICSALHRDEEAPPVHLVGDDTADLAQEQQRTELREVEEADVARRRRS